MPAELNGGHRVTLDDETTRGKISTNIQRNANNANETTNGHGRGQRQKQAKGVTFAPHHAQEVEEASSGFIAKAKSLGHLAKKVMPTSRAISQVVVGSTGDHDTIKLEVITAKEMMTIRFIQLFATLYNLVYLGLVTGFSRTRWRNDPKCTPARCDRSDLRAFVWYNFISISVMCVINLSYFFYFVHVVRRIKSRRPEPYWAMSLLLPILFLSNNPLMYCDRLYFFHVSTSVRNVLAGFRYFTVSLAVSSFPLYIILKTGSFVRTRNLDEPYRIKFYLVRVIPMLVLLVLFLGSAVPLRIELSPQPFVSAVALSQSGLDFPKRAFVVVGATGALQLLFFGGFFLYYMRLSRKIVKLNYRQTRLKVLNLLFFYQHTLIPVGLVIIFSAVSASLFVQDVAALGFQTVPNSIIEKTILDVPYFARSGIVAVYSAYAIIESYVSLPSKYNPTWLERLIIRRLYHRVGGLLMPQEPSSSDERDSEGEESNKTRRKDVQFSPEGTDESVCHSSDVVESMVPFIWRVDSQSGSASLIQRKRSGKLRMDESILCFNMSWLAYLHDHVIDAALKDKDHSEFVLRKIWREQTRDLVVITVESRDKLIVSFRGTVSAANWKVNLIVSQAAHLPLVDPEWLQDNWKAPAWGAKRPRVHRGFHDAYESLRNEVLEDIQSCLADGRPRRVFCTGHSLGGALATLCAFDCRVDLGIPDERVSCITFGSPKVGNRAFTRRFAVSVSDTFRFVNNSDVVTNVPKRLYHVYEHVPRGVLIDSFGNLIIDPMYADLKLFHGNLFTPHMMGSYQQSIQAFIDSTTETKYVADWWDFTKYEGGQEGVEQAAADMKHVGEELAEDPMESLLEDGIEAVRNLDAGTLYSGDRDRSKRSSTQITLPVAQKPTPPASPRFRPSGAAADHASPTMPHSPSRQPNRLQKMKTSGRQLLGVASPFVDLDVDSEGLLGRAATSTGTLMPPPRVTDPECLSSDTIPIGDATIRLHTLIIEP